MRAIAACQILGLQLVGDVWTGYPYGNRLSVLVNIDDLVPAQDFDTKFPGALFEQFFSARLRNLEAIRMAKVDFPEVDWETSQS